MSTATFQLVRKLATIFLMLLMLLWNTVFMMSLGDSSFSSWYEITSVLYSFHNK